MTSSALSSDHSSHPVPVDLVQQVLRRWWLAAVGTVLGGLVGLGFHLLAPPLYQAEAVIHSAVDYDRTGPLGDVEQDYMIRQVGHLIGSDQVIEAALVQAAGQGLDIDRAEFDEMTDLQRSFDEWQLIARGSDAQQTVLLANLWADAAWATLSESLGHLTALDAYKQALEAQLYCQEAQASAGPGPVCNMAAFAQLSDQIDRTLAVLQTEEKAANGLVNGTVIRFSSHAQIPARPLVRGRNILMLAGALLGLSAALVMVFTRKTA